MKNAYMLTLCTSPRSGMDIHM